MQYTDKVLSIYVANNGILSIHEAFQPYFGK